jgi:hypothetical protein
VFQTSRTFAPWIGTLHSWHFVNIIFNTYGRNDVARKSTNQALWGGTAVAPFTGQYGGYCMIAFESAKCRFVQFAVWTITAKFMALGQRAA